MKKEELKKLFDEIVDKYADDDIEAAESHEDEAKEDVEDEPKEQDEAKEETEEEEAAADEAKDDTETKVEEVVEEGADKDKEDIFKGFNDRLTAIETAIGEIKKEHEAKEYGINGAESNGDITDRDIYQDKLKEIFG